MNLWRLGQSSGVSILKFSLHKSAHVAELLVDSS